MIVRWGLEELPSVLSEVGIERPLLVASPRWSSLDLPHAARWDEVPSDTIEAPDDVDGVLAVGGGSAIDTAKAPSAARGLPVVSVPTTYSGSEWAHTFGVRDPGRKMVGGGGGARMAGIVYEPQLTLELPRAQTGGTALNALAHTAEALYAKGHTPEGDARALEGAHLIADVLPRVLEHPEDLELRTHLLEGASHAGEALSIAGLALGHAMAQAVGGTYGVAHGTSNAICLPAALRFNAGLVPDAVRRFGEAIGAPDDPAAKVTELAALAGPTRLRDLGVPEEDLPRLGATAAARGGNQANPRPATPEEVTELLRSVW
ncbi:MAG TPA: iron-containing alcohol dehydrogenase [Gaiellaceae bacterium]|nr:iron-containing alcohol dehydrogenase [Gaiellaceae bacterium]